MRKDRYTYKGLRSVLSHRESSVSICPHCVSEHQYYWHKSLDWLKSAFFFMLFVSLMYNPGLQSEDCFSFPLFCALIASGLIHFFHYHNVLPLGVLIINGRRISVKKMLLSLSILEHSLEYSLWDHCTHQSMKEGAGGHTGTFDTCMVLVLHSDQWPWDKSLCPSSKLLLQRAR